MFFSFGSSSETDKVAPEGRVIVLLSLWPFMFKLEEKHVVWWCILSYDDKAYFNSKRFAPCHIGTHATSLRYSWQNHQTDQNGPNDLWISASVLLFLILKPELTSYPLCNTDEGWDLCVGCDFHMNEANIHSVGGDIKSDVLCCSFSVLEEEEELKEKLYSTLIKDGCKNQENTTCAIFTECGCRDNLSCFLMIEDWWEGMFCKSTLTVAHKFLQFSKLHFRVAHVQGC